MDLLTVVGVAALAAVIGYIIGRRRAIDGIGGSRAVASEAPVPASTSAPVSMSTPLAAPQGQPVGGIERALADLRLGVVVVAADGSEVYRNNQAAAYGTGRHGDALIDAALERVVAGALLGRSPEERVEIYGPPARSLLVQASPTYEGAELHGAVGVIDDVTEVSHMLRVRSDFVANVSHELRTPVGAMSVLAETIADADNPEVVDRLSRRMLREATRLADTIEDLLTLSRLESGPVAEPETIDLAAVAALAVERTSEAAAQRSVEVVINRGDRGPVLIDGDQGQLVSAVANLVDNAIKHSDAGGEVEISITAAAGSRLAELTVLDHGTGIPDRDQERIFERFYRVDSGRSRETGGTGLGLAIVRHAVLNHQGTVDVDSVEGRGSTFTIRLPLSSAQEHQEADIEDRGRA